MKKTINFYDFERAFATTRPDYFSYHALSTLWEWFEEYDEINDSDTELDVIGICCEFSEYENIEEFHKDYDKEKYPDTDTLMDYTTVIHMCEKSFIIMNF
tara:strand:- start:2925 stop:3224 length:300 start_codon:yes stop_codon:yes gene_type:complete